jgi:hypothetical protein
MQQVEQPGLALQKAVHRYLHAPRAAPLPDAPLPDDVIDTLRQVIRSDFGGGASMYTRRMMVTSEWLTRLNYALNAAAFDDETVARVMRHARKELSDAIPISH